MKYSGGTYILLLKYSGGYLYLTFEVKFMLRRRKEI